jgi:hypothetical protein
MRYVKRNKWGPDQRQTDVARVLFWVKTFRIWRTGAQAEAYATERHFTVHRVRFRARAKIGEMPRNRSAQAGVPVPLKAREPAGRLAFTADKAHDEEGVVVATWAGGWQIRANVGT